MGSLALAAIGCKAIWRLFQMRHALETGWAGDIEENKWGVGQVLALFAWTPWLIEMASSVVKPVRRSSGSEREQSPSQASENIMLDQLT